MGRLTNCFVEGKFILFYISLVLIINILQPINIILEYYNKIKTYYTVNFFKTLTEKLLKI